MKSAIIRMGLSVFLLYGVYTETGIFTVITLSLIFVGAEIVGYKASQMLKG